MNADLINSNCVSASCVAAERKRGVKYNTGQGMFISPKFTENKRKFFNLSEIWAALPVEQVVLTPIPSAFLQDPAIMHYILLRPPLRYPKSMYAGK